MWKIKSLDLSKKAKINNNQLNNLDKKNNLINLINYLINLINYLIRYLIKNPKFDILK